MNTKHHQIKSIISTLKNHFSQLYKVRLKDLILFGSQARGDAQFDSDIDILVVLKGEVNPVKEIKNNSDFISNLCLEYDAVINCFYLSETRLNQDDDLFINNVKKDGVLL